MTTYGQAVRYWKAACLLATTHVYGLTWPPPGRAQRSRVVGHWGCNPGIAWVVGCLAAQWRDADPFLFVVGTGHASSFAFAHQAIRERWPPERISVAAARYGQPGGEPSELLGAPGVPYLGGELGPALAVSQGIAASSQASRLVVCVVGDGECETPVALAAFAHRDVLLSADEGAAWLPVVNANGARMGGPTRFEGHALRRMLEGMGYTVFVSGVDGAEAVEAASGALAACLAGEPAVWISRTEKGWPAPAVLGGGTFRGHLAHKPRELHPSDPVAWHDLRRWLVAFHDADLLDENGLVADEIVAVAQRASLQAPASLPPLMSAQGRRPSSRAASRDAIRPTRVCWSRPVEAVDAELAARRTVVLSPDEALSNRLRACMSAGLVREVLAEEVCAAWAWGTVEAGREAAFVTYEAFAPLASTLLAQYAKMVHTRPRRGKPPLLVVVSSLGWANSPTHQNSDLGATILARPWPRMKLLCPLGARSARQRTRQLLDCERDGVSVVVCSKQPLLDLTDPGSPLVELRIAGGPEGTATLVAIGDVCVTEAVAAMVAAASRGVGLRVLAVIDLKELGYTASDLWNHPHDGATVGVAWCAPRLVAPILWQAAQRLFPVSGYEERWGATAWETLQANSMDRVSLLEALAAAGADVSSNVIFSLRRSLARAAGFTGVSVPPFKCPPLIVTPMPTATVRR